MDETQDKQTSRRAFLKSSAVTAAAVAGIPAAAIVMNPEEAEAAQKDLIEVAVRQKGASQKKTDRQQKRRKRPLTGYVPISKIDILPHHGYTNGGVQVINRNYDVYVSVELEGPANEKQVYDVKLSWGPNNRHGEITVDPTKTVSSKYKFLPPNPYVSMDGWVEVTHTSGGAPAPAEPIVWEQLWLTNY
jgi:hypothetical protein